MFARSNSFDPFRRSSEGSIQWRSERWDYTAVFKRAYKTVEQSCPTIFACPRLTSRWSSGKWLSIPFRAFVRPTKADASPFARATYNLSNRTTNWTSCRQIRFSDFCRVTRVRASLMLRSDRMHRVASCSTLALAPYVCMCERGREREGGWTKKQNNHWLPMHSLRLSVLHICVTTSH